MEELYVQGGPPIPPHGQELHPARAKKQMDSTSMLKHSELHLETQFKGHAKYIKKSTPPLLKIGEKNVVQHLERDVTTVL